MELKEIEEGLKNRKIKAIGKKKHYSVLIPIVCLGSELYFLYEKRADGIRQPGDICFPGGRMEECETPSECALRETMEETGIKNIRLLGEFDTLYEMSERVLYTVVGLIEAPDLNQLELNTDEVKEVFLVPISFFLENEPYTYSGKIVQHVDDFPYEQMGISADYKWRKGVNNIYVYHYENYVIWGLTAKITKWFTDEMSGRNPY